MTLTPDQIRTAALQLDPVEREALAEELLLSIRATDGAAIDAAWLDEAHRRDAAFHSSITGSKPVEQVLDVGRR